METTAVLKAAADETRLKILKMLLQHNYCVRALSRNLGLSEAAVSQHLKVLREADLLIGEKKGYFMHYDVNRETLHKLASEIEEMASIERETCNPKDGGCKPAEQGRCHVHEDEYEHECSHEVRSFCHENNQDEGSGGHHGNC